MNTPRLAVIAIALAAAACEPTAQAPKSTAPAGEWREFEGSWNASGRRHVLPFGAGRRAAIIDLRGTMLLSGPGRPGVGFRAELIGLSDSTSGLVARGVWTDERGDQVFSELKGEGDTQKNRITGTIVGGTGRYANVTGSYEFSWRFVLEAEDGSIQGSATGLKGRVRAAPAGTGESK